MHNQIIFPSHALPRVQICTCHMIEKILRDTVQKGAISDAMRNVTDCLSTQYV